MWANLVFLVILSQLVNARVTRSVGSSDPSIKKIVVYDTGVVISWNIVESADVNNPIEGYKLNVFEVPNKIVNVFKTINGTEQLVEESRPRTLFDDVPPEVKPKVYIVSADKNMTRVDDIKRHAIYQLRVQAFTKTEDGPLSYPTGLQIGGDAESPED